MSFILRYIFINILPYIIIGQFFGFLISDYFIIFSFNLDFNLFFNFFFNFHFISIFCIWLISYFFYINSIISLSNSYNLLLGNLSVFKINIIYMVLPCMVNFIIFNLFYGLIFINSLSLLEYCLIAIFLLVTNSLIISLFFIYSFFYGFYLFFIFFLVLNIYILVLFNLYNLWFFGVNGFILFYLFGCFILYLALYFNI